MQWDEGSTNVQDILEIAATHRLDEFDEKSAAQAFKPSI